MKVMKQNMDRGDFTCQAKIFKKVLPIDFSVLINNFFYTGSELGC
jgi:hypothetical protein